MAVGGGRAVNGSEMVSSLLGQITHCYVKVLGLW